MAEVTPWWRKDIDEMWAMALLGAIGLYALVCGVDQVASVAAGAFAVYLGKGKTVNGAGP